MKDLMWIDKDDFEKPDLTEPLELIGQLKELGMAGIFWKNVVGKYGEVGAGAYKGEFKDTSYGYLGNEIFLQRSKGIGIPPADKALEYGVSGPNLRGSGVDFDLRHDGRDALVDPALTEVVDQVLLEHVPDCTLRVGSAVVERDLMELAARHFGTTQNEAHLRAIAMGQYELVLGVQTGDSWGHLRGCLEHVLDVAVSRFLAVARDLVGQRQAAGQARCVGEDVEIVVEMRDEHPFVGVQVIYDHDTLVEHVDHDVCDRRLVRLVQDGDVAFGQIEVTLLDVVDHPPGRAH